MKPLFINETSMRYIPRSPFFMRSTVGLIKPMPRQISTIKVSIRKPVSASEPDSSISLLMTEDRIIPTKNKFMTSLLSPLLNSGPTSFILAHK